MSVNPEDKEMDIAVSMFSYNGSQNVNSIDRFYINKDFVIDVVKVIDGEKGKLAAMPTKAKTGNDGQTEYNQVCYLVTKEFREEMYWIMEIVAECVSTT